jgi:TatA/E family protein of Tat protein translocase
MLSIPHMIVVFLVVLVVFGPQKLPELARSFGKLMAEFRKASNDFKSAFEEEMRDLERQARIAELKKQVAEATAAATAAEAKAAEATAAAANAAPGGSGNGATEAAAGSRTAEAPVIAPVADTVPRLDANNGESAAVAEHHPAEAGNEAVRSSAERATESSPSHDQQQPV